jgi:Ca-activated chloride channel family protein
MAIFATRSSSVIESSRRRPNLSSMHAFPALAVFLGASFVLIANTRSVSQADVHAAYMSPPMHVASKTQAMLRANVDLVLVNATVLDRLDRAVTGLAPRDFTVLDDKKPQIIRYLSNVDEPISLVVVLDASSSMADKFHQVRGALAELVKTSNPQDEFGLIVIQDKPSIVVDFDDVEKKLQNVTETLEPNGMTALWDGISFGVDLLGNARYRRQAIVVISDGGDNHSRHTESQLKSILEESNVGVYAIGLFSRFVTRPEERVGPLQLDEVAGGRVFAVHDSEELLRAITQVSHELRSQYVLGYYPTNRERDGKWRKLKIRLAGKAAQGKLKVYSKQGYYAPAE